MKPSGTVWQPMVLLATLTLFFFAFSGCNSKPTDQAAKADEDVNYAVYFYSMTGDRGMYIYNPLTQELDSADLHFELIGYEHFKSMHLSSDGELIYMPFKETVVVFDTDLLNPITELPYRTNSPVAVSPDGRYIAIFGNGVWVLNSSDYSVYYHDTISAHNGVYSANGMRLYAIGSESQAPFATYLYALDLSGPEPVSGKTGLPGHPHRLQPTSDGSKLLLLGALSSFAIYDIASDSLILTHNMLGAYGRVALTPDDRYAFYGSPATIVPPDGGTSAFAMIDVHNNLVEEVVDTRYVADSVTPDWFGVRSVLATPDGKYLVMLDGPMANELLLFDIATRTFVDYIDFGRNVELTDMDLRIITE